MSLPEISIRRPVFATVMSLALLLIGMMSYSRLTVREYPKIDEPVVTVETTYRGASAEIIESQITQPLEDSLSGIEGIDVMTSISRPERSQITVRFRVTRDVDIAASDVRDRVARVRARLPDEIDEPVIAKVEADAQPIIYLAFSSDRHSPLEVTDYADRFVKDRLQNLPGIADVRIFGERRYAMRIWLDALRLAAYGLTPQDVEAALRRQNVEVPVGPHREQPARVHGAVARPTCARPSSSTMIVKRRRRLSRAACGDVGARRHRAASDATARDRALHGQLRGGARRRQAVDRQSARRLQRGDVASCRSPVESLPEGMSVKNAYDSSIFIARSIENVSPHHRRGGRPRRARDLRLPALAARHADPAGHHPGLLIGVFFALMHALGFSINTLTLLAIVLAVGLVVDDAIVMLENIHRHIEEGMSPYKAARSDQGDHLRGHRDDDHAGRGLRAGVHDRAHGPALHRVRADRGGAVIVSGFVALTLTPMMCRSCSGISRTTAPSTAPASACSKA
jgi:multidrug efflux pump